MATEIFVNSQWINEDAFNADASKPAGAVWGSTAFNNLQSAVNAASATEPTTITVAAGTYNEDIVLDARSMEQKGNLKFVAAEGADVTFAGKITIGYYEKRVGSHKWDADVAFENITFDQAAAQEHSIDIQQCNDFAMTNCKVIGDGEYGILGTNVDNGATITGTTFENAAIQSAGSFGTNFLIDDCTFNESRVNIQSGNSVTIKNSTFNGTLTDANVGDSFYCIRSNDNAINIENTTFNIDSELTEVAGEQAKWGVLWQRNAGGTKWSAEDITVNFSDKAMEQTELLFNKNGTTNAANEAGRITINGLTSTDNDVTDLLAKSEGALNAAADGVSYVLDDGVVQSKTAANQLVVSADVAEMTADAEIVIGGYTYIVGKTAFATIKAALTEAKKSTEKITIEIAAGDYTENISFGDRTFVENETTYTGGITFKAVDGAVVNINGYFQCNSPVNDIKDVVFEGLNITNSVRNGGYFAPIMFGDNYAGKTASGLAVKNCTLTSTADGGTASGVALAMTLKCDGIDITKNTINADCGVYGGDGNLIANTNISGNTMNGNETVPSYNYWGMVYIYNSGEGNVISGNEITGSALDYAVRVRNGEGVILTDNTITDCGNTQFTNGSVVTGTTVDGNALSDSYPAYDGLALTVCGSIAGETGDTVIIDGKAYVVGNNAFVDISEAMQQISQDKTDIVISGTGLLTGKNGVFNGWGNDVGEVALYEIGDKTVNWTAAEGKTALLDVAARHVVLHGTGTLTIDESVTIDYRQASGNGLGESLFAVGSFWVGDDNTDKPTVVLHGDVIIGDVAVAADNGSVKVRHGNLEVSQTGSIDADYSIRVRDGELKVTGTGKDAETAQLKSQRLELGGSADGASNIKIKDSYIDITYGGGKIADRFDNNTDGVGYEKSFEFDNSKVVTGTLNLLDSVTTFDAVDSEFEVKNVTNAGSIVLNNSDFTASGTVTNNGTINVAGESTLNIAELSENTIDFMDGAIIKDSTVGGGVFVAGNVTFRGDNTFGMITDFGTLTDYYGTTAPMAWTVEAGASVTLNNKARYGLGYGDKVVINGEIAENGAAAARAALNDDDASNDVKQSLFMHGLVAQESAGWNCDSSFTVNNAFVTIGSNSSFGSKAGNYGGNYTFNFNNSVLNSSRITFYNTNAKTTFTLTGSDVELGQFMTRDQDSVFTLDNSKLVSTSTINGNDEGQYNAGTLNLINGSTLTYSSAMTNEATGKIVISSDSKLIAPEIIMVDGASITIDGTGFTSDTNKVIDLNGTESLQGKITIENLEDGITVAYGKDGDVLVTDASMETLYVGNAYAGKEFGESVDGKVVGVNAFDSVFAAVGAQTENTTAIKIESDISEALSDAYPYSGKLVADKAVTVTDTANIGLEFIDLTIGENVTVNSKAIYWQGENTIDGKVVAASTFYNYNSNKTVINGTVEAGNTFNRYQGSVDNGIYIVGSAEAGEGKNAAVQYKATGYLGQYSGTFSVKDSAAEFGYILLNGDTDGDGYSQAQLVADNALIKTIGGPNTQPGQVLMNGDAAIVATNGSVLDFRGPKDFGYLSMGANNSISLTDSEMYLGQDGQGSNTLAGTITLTNSTLNSLGKLNSTAAITIDETSSIVATTITGTGTITIDVKGYTGDTFKAIDVNSAIANTVKLTNTGNKYYLTYGDDGDVYVTKSPEFVYVSSDYNSSTEGWGTTKFSSYNGAYAFTSTNAKKATIVFEKTTTISGNCPGKQDDGVAAVIIKDGAAIGNANSKWDAVFALTIEAGGILQSACPSSASYGNTHVKNKWVIGEAGSDKQAKILFVNGKSGITYQTMSIALLAATITANNALIEVGDLGLLANASFTDTTLTIEGILASKSTGLYKTTMTDTTVTIKGHNLMNENTYYSTVGTILGNLTMDNTSIEVDDKVDTTVAEKVWLGYTGNAAQTLTMTNGSSITVEKGTEVAVANKVVMTDSSITAGNINVGDTKAASFNFNQLEKGKVYYAVIYDADGNEIETIVRTSTSGSTFYPKFSMLPAGKCFKDEAKTELHQEKTYTFEAIGSMDLTNSDVYGEEIALGGNNLTMDYQSTLGFSSIKGGYITVKNASDYVDNEGVSDGNYRIFDYTGSGTMTEADYKALLNNVWHDNYKVMNNDLYLTDQEAETIYINSAWNKNGFGDTVGEGYLYGYNAFDSFASMNASSATTGMVVYGGTYSQAEGVYNNSASVLKGGITSVTTEGDVIIDKGSLVFATEYAGEVTIDGNFTTTDKIRYTGTWGVDWTESQNGHIRFVGGDDTVFQINGAFTSGENIQFIGGSAVISENSVLSNDPANWGQYLISGADVTNYGKMSLDLNGVNGSAMNITNGGSLTISGSDAELTVNMKDGGASNKDINVTNGSLNVEDGAKVNATGAVTVAKDGSITIDNAAFSAAVLTNSNLITIKGDSDITVGEIQNGNAILHIENYTREFDLPVSGGTIKVTGKLKLAAGADITGVVVDGGKLVISGDDQTVQLAENSTVTLVVDEAATLTAGDDFIGNVDITGEGVLTADDALFKGNKVSGVKLNITNADGAINVDAGLENIAKINGNEIKNFDGVYYFTEEVTDDKGTDDTSDDVTAFVTNILSKDENGISYAAQGSGDGDDDSVDGEKEFGNVTIKGEDSVNPDLDITMKKGNVTIKVANGKADDKTVFEIGSIDKDEDGGKTNLSFGNDTDVAIKGDVESMGNLTVGKNSSLDVAGTLNGKNLNQSIKIGAGAVANFDEVDLKGGKNSFSVAAGAEVTTADLIGISTLSLAAGKESDFAAMTVNNYIAAAANNSITLGNYAELTINGKIDNGGVASGTGTTIKAGNFSSVEVKEVDGLAGLTLGKESGFTAASINGTEKSNKINLGADAEVIVEDAINLKHGNNSIVLGKSAYLKATSISNVPTITLAADADMVVVKDVDDLQKLTVGSGSFSAANINGTEKSDKINLGADAELTTGAIDLKAGKNSITLGKGADLTATSISNVQTINGGAEAGLDVADITGVQKLSIGKGGWLDADVISGTDGNDTFNFANESVICGKDVIALDFGEGKNTLSIGNKAQGYFADTIFGTGNDTVKIGNDSIVTFGDLDMGEADNGKDKDTLTIGKNAKVYVNKLAGVETLNATKGAEIWFNNDADADVNLTDVKGSWKNAEIYDDMGGVTASGELSGNVYANEYDVYEINREVAHITAGDGIEVWYSIDNGETWSEYPWKSNDAGNIDYIRVGVDFTDKDQYAKKDYSITVELA